MHHLRVQRFGEWVRTCRLRQRKSQKELAGEVGLSQQLMSKVERIGIVPPGEQLQSLCTALGQSVTSARAIIDDAPTREPAYPTWQSTHQRIVSLVRAKAQRGDEINICMLVLNPEVETFPLLLPQCRDLLTVAPRAEVVLLFPDTLRIQGNVFTYESLAHALTRQEPKILQLKTRFFGYQATVPPAEMWPATSIPLHSVLLIVGAGFPKLYLCHIDHLRYEGRLREHDDQTRATIESAVLLSCSENQAALWVGSMTMFFNIFHHAESKGWELLKFPENILA